MWRLDPDPDNPDLDPDRDPRQRFACRGPCCKVQATYIVLWGVPAGLVAVACGISVMVKRREMSTMQPELAAGDSPIVTADGRRRHAPEPGRA